jgi:hypothetical protein
MLAFTGVGLIPAIGLNCALTYLFTQRLGKYVAERFDAINFQNDDLNVLLNSAKTIAPMLFVLPSFDELQQAIDAVKDLFPR